MAEGIANRLDRTISIRTFAIAFPALLTLLAATFLTAGYLGHDVVNGSDKIVGISTTNVSEIKSGDLKKIDFTMPPPKDATASEAGKPQQREIVEAVEGLQETSPYGSLPLIRKDGMTAFKAYAASFAADPSAKAFISFVIVDFGLSEKVSTPEITQLPEGVSFALSPYVQDAQKWTSSARKYNHEVWLSLPLQPADYPATDPGPKTILTKLNSQDSEKRLLQSLAASTGYVGIIVDNGKAFSDFKSQLANLLSNVSERGLGIVESDPTDQTLGASVAETKAPYAQNNVWLNDVSSDKDLQTKLIDIEAKAIKNKKLIVFMKPYPVFLKTLDIWSKNALARGIQLAPLSAVIQK